jgi:hypothetical protein
MPVLTEIFSLLEPLARDGSAVVRPLAREARMVMTARLASTSTKSTTRVPEEDSAEEIYQKALKLLQDPILPVRAHGLLLLRQLVSPPSTKRGKEPRLDNGALVPAILSIFLQSIHDDDSYVFLNAIQGLAAMVDTFGKDVLHGLLKEYTEGLEGLGSTSLTQHDVDSKIKIGEALGLVIRRCGETLGIYGKQPRVYYLALLIMTWAQWTCWCRHFSILLGHATFQPPYEHLLCPCWQNVKA